jgi:hypothetical protein
MRIIAHQRQVAETLPKLRQVGESDGWTTRFIDPSTGQRWTHTYLGSENHGGGLPVLVSDPMPSAGDLVKIASTSNDDAEIAASTWLLTEIDKEGNYREQLVRAAEAAASGGDQPRAALLVGWGALTRDANLRSTIGKDPAEVTADHKHFQDLAARAKALLHLSSTDPLLRDPKVFM